MFGLCFRLALTNLKKNRRLYYPYAIMTIVSTAISYIFASLAFHPDLGQVKGANGVTQVLGFGMIVVMLAVAIMVFMPIVLSCSNGQKSSVCIVFWVWRKNTFF